MMLRGGETHEGSTSPYLWSYDTATEIGTHSFGEASKVVFSGK